jgi:uncharacterized membrane protein YozB (DUF420 family)
MTAHALRTIRHLLWWSAVMTAMSHLETHGKKISELAYKMWTYDAACGVVSDGGVYTEKFMYKQKPEKGD